MSNREPKEKRPSLLSHFPVYVILLTIATLMSYSAIIAFFSTNVIEILIAAGVSVFLVALFLFTPSIMLKMTESN